MISTIEAGTLEIAVMRFSRSKIIEMFDCSISVSGERESVRNAHWELTVTQKKISELVNYKELYHHRLL
jgi:hypothetical protein